MLLYLQRVLERGPTSVGRNTVFSVRSPLMRKDLPPVQCWRFFVVIGLHNNFCGNKAVDAIARKEVVAS